MARKEIKIVIDTREQRPWVFPDIAGVVHRKLAYGDYSLEVDGVIRLDLLSIERKSANDLVGCVTGGRDRFKRMLSRMKASKYRYLIVEASLLDLAEGRYHSKAHPSSVIGSLISWSVRYGVHVIFGGQPAYCAAYALRLVKKIAGEIEDE